MSSMTVNVKVTNWENMDNTKRSLVNFLMSNAKIRLHGVYDSDDLYQGFTGSITHKYTAFQCISYGVSECMSYPVCYALNLPMTDIGNNTYPADVDKSTWLPLITSKLIESDSEISFAKYEYRPLQQTVEESDGVITVTTDQAESYTAHKICDITGNNASARVKIIPMIDGTPNTNQSLRPSNLLSASKNTISVNMLNTTPTVDYQLRTATFKSMTSGIDHGSSGSQSFPDHYGDECYYKIGIVPFSRDLSSVTLEPLGESVSISDKLDSIVNYLKSCKFDIKFISDDILTIGFADEEGFAMRLSASTSLGSTLTIDDSEYGVQYTSILPDSLIIPITSYKDSYNTSHYSDASDNYIDIEEYSIKGIAYLQLCSGTNNVDHLLKPIVAVSSNGSEWNVASLNEGCELAITDQGMNGEFIPYDLEESY